MRPKLGHTLADTKIQSVKDVCALFGRKERNSARRANTARLRVIAKEEYGEGGSHDYTQGFVSSKVLLRLRLLRRRHLIRRASHATFPSRGRLGCASKFYVNITRARRNRISTTEIRISRQLRRRKARPSECKLRGNTRRRRGNTHRRCGNCGAVRRVFGQDPKAGQARG